MKLKLKLTSHSLREYDLLKISRKKPQKKLLTKTKKKNFHQISPASNVKINSNEHYQNANYISYQQTDIVSICLISRTIPLTSTTSKT